ncbi:MAG: hypothetical protein AAF382_06805 [Pseudomonadota bacterium]
MTKAIFLSLIMVAVPFMANAKTVDCYCTNSSGDRVELGEMVCLFVNGRSFTAQCQMSLNNPMWREVNEGCLSS